MAKISEAAKADCIRMQNKYKDLLAGTESKLVNVEKDLLLLEDHFAICEKKIDAAVLYIQASSYIATTCYIAIEYIDVRSDNQLNDGRRYINKAIMLLEEVFGNHTDDSLSLNEEIHEYFKGKLTDQWKYEFLCWGKNKVMAMDEWAKENKIIPRVVRSYSDSRSDMPLMEIADDMVWVDKKTGLRKSA